MALLALGLLGTLLLPGHAQDRRGPGMLFPLRVAQEGSYLVDASGRPFLLVGDTAWSLIAQLGREDVARYLADRRRRGFNALLVNLLEHQFASRAPANVHGDRPFAPGRPFGPLNPAYFDHAAWVLEQAEAAGFAVFLTPAYLGANGSGQGWYMEAAAAGPSVLEAYGAAIAQRFSAHTNIVWVHGGDFDPPERDIVEAVVSGIDRVLPGALHTLHLARDAVPANTWSARPWLALDTAYTYGDTHAAVLAQHRAMPSRSLVMIEGLYEGEHATDAEMVRRQAYGAMLGGAAGQFYGNNPIWHFDGPGLFEAATGWQQALDSAGARSITHLRKVLESLPWWQMKPAAAIPGIQADGPAYLAATADGAFAIGYATGTDGRDFHLRLSERPGLLQWFDPSDGTFHPPARLSAAESVTPPATHNSGGQRDWVFVLRPEE